MSTDKARLYATSPLSHIRHTPLGIVQGYAHHQLSIGSRFGAALSNVFGGSSLNVDIGQHFQRIREEAFADLERHTSKLHPGSHAVVSIRYELLTMDINQGSDTLLVCNVSGTAVRFANEPGHGTGFSKSSTDKSTGGARRKRHPKVVASKRRAKRTKRTTRTKQTKQTGRT